MWLRCTLCTARPWTSPSTTGFGSPGSCSHLIQNLTDWSSHDSLESVPSLYRGTQCCTHTRRVQQCVPPPAPVPGSKVTPHYDGAGLSLVQGAGQSLAQGAGQSETDAAMPSAITICAAPLQERLVPRACQHQPCLEPQLRESKRLQSSFQGCHCPPSLHGELQLPVPAMRNPAQPRAALRLGRPHFKHFQNVWDLITYLPAMEQ